MRESVKTCVSEWIDEASLAMDVDGMARVGSLVGLAADRLGEEVQLNETAFIFWCAIR